MSPNDGSAYYSVRAVTLLLFLLIAQNTRSQVSILDSAFTFRAGTVKTGNALNLITRQTGFNFTYDSRLINAERRTDLTFSHTKLKVILNSILNNDSLAYSVIDQFIIISKLLPPPPPVDSAAAKMNEVKDISGLIIDEETSEPLPFATISLKHEGKGTVTNSNGEFGLKIPQSSLNDTITVMYLGYFAREIPVKQSLGNNFKIVMKREFISIPEIIIKNQIPQEIIYKTLSGINRNYGNTPANLTAFYREGVLKKEKLQTYTEAILRIYKSPYAGSLLNDQIKVFKSRKLENANIRDTVTIRLKAGLSTCLQLDGIRNTFDFIARENLSDYTYRLTDIVSFDDESAYEIEFSPKEESETSSFRGSVFINTADYAVLKADFEISPEYLHKMKESFILSPTKGFTTWPVSVSYSVSYRKVGERYFLSHVRGDLVFNSKQKKRLFNTQFNVFFEMAVTDISTTNVTRFDRDELAPIYSVFSKTIKNYDHAFWENQDFLKPEENLLQAIKNMKVKLPENTETEK